MKSVAVLLLPIFLVLATPFTSLHAAGHGTLTQFTAMELAPIQDQAVTNRIMTAVSQQQMNQAPTAANATWQALPLPANLSIEQIRDFAIHPQDAAIVYLATEHGLFHSNDAGDSWTRFETLGDILVFGLAQSETEPQRLYVESFQSYRSEDGGATWQPMSPPAGACGFAVAPSASTRVYARICGESNLPPVVRSDDGGQNWITPSSPVTETFEHLAVLPDQPDTLVATNFDQTWRSTDSGESWTRVLIGDRFFGKPTVDRQSPPTIYLGHWNGLLRSRDGGMTWEDSTAAREFSTLVPWFDAEMTEEIVSATGEATDGVVGGNGTAIWRFAINDSGWQAGEWGTLTGVEMLRRSAYDDGILYARTTQGLWRFDARSAPDFTPTDFIYLPLVQNGAPSASSSCTEECQPSSTVTVDTIAANTMFNTAMTDSDATDGTDGETDASTQAIAQANLYRDQIGLSRFQSHPAIVTAAQNHADYHVLNVGDNSAWTFGAHGEVEGKPNFTGKWPSDRIAAAGFPYSGGAEVIHGLGDPITSVDGWMATVYHRFPILDPNSTYVGYGYHSGAPVSVDVMDFGTGPTNSGNWILAAPHPQAYPADGQTDVPTSWNGAEHPNPLPPGVTGPVGYPFTLQPLGGDLTVTHVELRTEAGAVVAIHPSPADCNCLAVMAVNPLAPNTAYVVAVTGDVAGVAFQQEWRFTTGAETNIVTSAAGVANR